MSSLFKKVSTLIVFLALIFVVFSLQFSRKKTHQNRVAIANYGPHASLEETIRGLKEGLDQLGFKENETVHYEISHVNFDTSLVGQMIARLKADRPSVFVALSTPVAQRAKAEIKDIPVVFSAVTDPVAAGLIDSDLKSSGNITGASERQDLGAFLDFVKKILPHAQQIGMLFSTAEANDRALVKMMEAAASHHTMQVLAVPVDEARDIPVRMQKFRKSVDFIYVGTSGPIQPSLPVIVREADSMKIPVFNADADQVKNNQALGAFAVSYYQVGVNTAKIVAKILSGTPIEQIAPIFPTLEDHKGIISKKKAEQLGIHLTSQFDQITIVE